MCLDAPWEPPGALAESHDQSPLVCSNQPPKQHSRGAPGQARGVRLDGGKAPGAGNGRKAVAQRRDAQEGRRAVLQPRRALPPPAQVDQW